MPDRSDSRIRLCVVTPAHWKAQSGGAEYQIDCILKSLLPSGRYDVSYIARHVVADYQPDDYRIVPIGKSGRHPRWGYLEDAAALYRALKRARPHVIYQRVGCGYTGVCAHYAQRHQARMVWHVAHDTDVSRESLPDGRNPVRRFLEKRSIEYGLRRAAAIVTQTKAQSVLLESAYARHADRLILNFQPLPEEQVGKRLPRKVVWVANLKPWKQPDAFVRLAQSLRDLDDVEFLMVGAPSSGAGDRVWADELNKQIEKTPNLRFLGALPQLEVNRLLARSHLFVNTSLQEGFPNTFIQAWMREVPVVSLNVDPDGVLERERIGSFAGNETRLSTTVRALLTNDAQRGEMAQRARDYAFANHSPSNARALGDLIDACAAQVLA